jgi:hypothetical protein
VAIPLSGRVPGRASRPSRSRVDDSGGLRCVSGKLIGCLDFSRRGVFIGEWVASELDQGGLTIRGAGQGLAALPYGVAARGPPLSPLRTSGSFGKY